MGIPILLRWHLYIETGPRSPKPLVYLQHNQTKCYHDRHSKMLPKISYPLWHPHSSSLFFLHLFKRLGILNLFEKNPGFGLFPLVPVVCFPVLGSVPLLVLGLLLSFIVPKGPCPGFTFFTLGLNLPSFTSFWPNLPWNESRKLDPSSIWSANLVI